MVHRYTEAASCSRMKNPSSARRCPAARPCSPYIPNSRSRVPVSSLPADVLPSDEILIPACVPAIPFPVHPWAGRAAQACLLASPVGCLFLESFGIVSAWWRHTSDWKLPLGGRSEARRGSLHYATARVVRVPFFCRFEGAVLHLTRTAVSWHVNKRVLRG